MNELKGQTQLANILYFLKEPANILKNYLIITLIIFLCNILNKIKWSIRQFKGANTNYLLMYFF